MNKWKRILPLVVLTLASCKVSMPATFWTEFAAYLQTEKASDQRPSGGIRAIHWQAKDPGTFSTKKIVEYAKVNEWILVDSSRFTANEMNAWEYADKPIFPLSYDGFHPSGMPENDIFHYFPRWFTSDALVLYFKTGWISVTPGTEDRNEVNGFVLVNKEMDEMAVYHLWGEWENH